MNDGLIERNEVPSAKGPGPLPLTEQGEETTDWFPDPYQAPSREPMQAAARVPVTVGRGNGMSEEIRMGEYDCPCHRHSN